MIKTIFIEKGGFRMYVIVKNRELDEPFCFERLNENGDWAGIGPYDPEKIIPCWVACDEGGCVYWIDPETGKMTDTPLDQDQMYEEWLRMVGDPDYPSARVVDAPWQRVLSEKLETMGQVEIAKKCKISQSTISRLLSGNRVPSLRLLMKLSRGLRVPLEELSRGLVPLLK